jgi:hypothetical protein
MRAVIHRVRSDRRLAIALVVAVLLLSAWIAWTVYVWNENGSDAGIGVLVSWPAALAALALIASPFVVGAWLLRSREQEGRDEGDAVDDPVGGEVADEDRGTAATG